VIDGAAAGLDFAQREAAARSLRLSLRQADAERAGLHRQSFDYVLSWNVIFTARWATSAASSATSGVLRLAGLLQESRTCRLFD
jgi:hypothetical protein